MVYRRLPLQTGTQGSRLYCEQVEDVDDEDEALQIVNSATSDMKDVDPLAWSSANNYWPIMGQQMLEGNL